MYRPPIEVKLRYEFERLNEEFQKEYEKTFEEASSDLRKKEKKKEERNLLKDAKVNIEKQWQETSVLRLEFPCYLD